MGARQSIWPLLLYGALVAIAAARRRQVEPPLGAAIDETGRGSVLKISPPHGAKDENASRARSCACGSGQAATGAFRERRAGFGAAAPGGGAGKGSARNGSVAHSPWRGWKDIFWRVYASVNDNRLLAVAAGVVFYTILAIFPAIAAFVSLYGLVADASTIDLHLSLAAGIFPAGAVEILHEQITKLAAKSDAKLSLGFVSWACHSLLERQRRNESHHRRPQRRL